MSHDRGCPCGAERWEYATCQMPDCLRRNLVRSIEASCGHPEYRIVSDRAIDGQRRLVTYRCTTCSRKLSVQVLFADDEPVPPSRVLHRRDS